MSADEAVPDLIEPTPIDKLVAWMGPPRGYQLTRWLVLRLLGFIYVFAFLGLILQGPPLLGSHGLTPVGTYLDQLHANGVGFWDAPSLLWADSSDGAMAVWAWIGFALSLSVLIGYANLPILLALWVIYGSFVRVGNLWFSFGWEIQILETTLLAAVLAHPWDPRPLKAPSPPATSIVLMRWLVFRIMLGAGLIKLRGDACWTDLTCLDAHFETQPIPNPLSPLFHHAPHFVHVLGVLFNHLVEVVLPWFAFGPRRLRLIAAVGMASFQIVLIASGNLAFLNWLTLVPILACFDDDFLLRMTPRRLHTWLQSRLTGPAPRKRWNVHQIIAIVFAVIVAFASIPVIGNLMSKHQDMNRSYDRFDLVNTYGAFGSVGMERNELVIEGTRDPDPDKATWQAYALPCEPGPLDRRPCLLGPYHRRLDWLIWFAAMNDEPRDAWVIHLVYKLLDGDKMIRGQLAIDPFDGEKPTYVRIRRFQYHLEPYGSDTWWTRDHDELWLPPVALDTPGLLDALKPYGWPSPSVH
jgi:hypothetical protein